jgi:hypothetical protein
MFEAGPIRSPAQRRADRTRASIKFEGRGLPIQAFSIEPVNFDVLVGAALKQKKGVVLVPGCALTPGAGFDFGGLSEV